MNNWHPQMFNRKDIWYKFLLRIINARVYQERFVIVVEGRGAVRTCFQETADARANVIIFLRFGTWFCVIFWFWWYFWKRLCIWMNFQKFRFRWIAAMIGYRMFCLNGDRFGIWVHFSIMSCLYFEAIVFRVNKLTSCNVTAIWKKNNKFLYIFVNLIHGQSYFSHLLCYKFNSPDNTVSDVRSSS